MSTAAETVSPPQSAAESLRERRVRQVEILISTLLRIGVLVSLSVVVIGTVFTFANHHEYVRSHEALIRVTGMSTEFPHTLTQVLHGIMMLEGRSIIMLGLLLLVATPVMRVAVSIFAFVYERDRKYVVITTIVLMFLLLSFVLGKVEG